MLNFLLLFILLGFRPLGQCGRGSCVSLRLKFMPRRLNGTLNRGLVHVTCAPSKTDFKAPYPHCEREFVGAGYTHIRSIREKKTQNKRRNLIYWANSRQRIYALANAKKKKSMFLKIFQKECSPFVLIISYIFLLTCPV